MPYYQRLEIRASDELSLSSLRLVLLVRPRARSSWEVHHTRSIALPRPDFLLVARSIYVHSVANLPGFSIGWETTPHSPPSTKPPPSPFYRSTHQTSPHRTAPHTKGFHFTRSYFAILSNTALATTSPAHPSARAQVGKPQLVATRATRTCAS